MKTKARIYQNPGDGHGIVLSGEVVSFFLGTEGWNVVMKGSRIAEEHPELFDIINDQTQGKMLKGKYEMIEPKSKAEIERDNTVWLGFRLDSGVRVQIYNTEE